MIILEERKSRRDKGKKERDRVITCPILRRAKTKTKVSSLRMRMREELVSQPNQSSKKHLRTEKYKKELPTSSRGVKLPEIIK